jgi:hypothetical protein
MHCKGCKLLMSFLLSLNTVTNSCYGSHCDDSHWFSVMWRYLSQNFVHRCLQFGGPRSKKGERGRDQASHRYKSIYKIIILYIVTYRGLAWLIIVGSRFDDWMYWTSVLQLQLIITANTLNSFLIMNLSLYFYCFSNWSLVFCYSYYSIRLTASKLRLTQFLSLEPYVTTYCQSASLFWNKAPIWGLRPDLYYCQSVAGLLMWGALSDERTRLSFAIAAGSRQRSHSRARVPWNSRS